MTATDGFTQMIDDATVFFTELAANNQKAWFDPRKAHYTEAIKKPAEFFTTVMEEEIAKLLGRPVKGKLFRIYRDVRFSKDKTPYNPHLHILWSGTGEAPLTPAVFFAAEPNGLWMGYGIPGAKGAALTQLRSLIDRKGAEIATAIESSGMTLSTWGPPPLKRVPAPYPPDHPQAELLKRKNLVIGGAIDAGWRAHPAGLIGAFRDDLRKVLPLDQVFASARR